jgi:hypothetical protein
MTVQLHHNVDQEINIVIKDMEEQVGTALLVRRLSLPMKSRNARLTHPADPIALVRSIY